MKSHHTATVPPIKIRQKDFLALAEKDMAMRAIGSRGEILVRSAGGHMVRAQIIP